MITLSFHLWSIVVGLFIGLIVTSLATLAVLYGDRWSEGFGIGFKDGMEYQKSKEKPKDGET